MSLLERFAPVLSANVRQAATIRDLRRLTDRQRGHINVVERERDEAWALVLDLQMDVAELTAEKASLMETCPSDIQEAEW